MAIDTTIENNVVDLPPAPAFFGIFVDSWANKTSGYFF